MVNNGLGIAVSGVGGGVGQSIVKALEETDYRIVALDGEQLGTGLYAAPRSYVIPYANRTDYIDRVLAICKQEDCKLLFPGLDAELAPLSKSIDRFKEAGVTIVVSSKDVIDISDNKMLTYSCLNRFGIEMPKTFDLSITLIEDLDLTFPFIVKKRVGGARSKDVYLVKNQKELNSLKVSNVDLKEFVAQEYIEGDEYTCGSINFDGNCMGVIVMKRILRDGDTYKCFAVKDTAIENQIRKIMSEIKPFGACNVQLRLRNNIPYVFEINARCSGTTAARALCGFNEPKMIADYILLDKKPEYKIKYQAVLRYWKEYVVSNELITKIKDKGRLEQDEFKSL